MAYGFKRAITIDHTKVQSANQTNFPVLIAGTYAYLAVTGSGGNVENSSGYDIAFYSDLALTTQLKHEVEKWVSTTGEVVYWVKVPTVSTSVDTVIYLAYGDAAVVTDQSDKVNVWDSNYKGVWHMADNAATTAVVDTLGTNNGTAQANTSTKTATGKIAAGLNFNGTSDKVTSGSTTYADPAVPFTMSAWAQLTDFASSAFTVLFAFKSSDGNVYEVFFSNNGGYTGVNLGSASVWSRLKTNVTAPTGATFHKIDITYNGSAAGTAGNFTLYIDGVSITLTASGAFSAATNATTFGDDGSGARWKGIIDEIRFSIVDRGANWIVTEFNNQNDPSLFYSIGSPITAAGAGHYYAMSQGLN